MAIAAMLVFNAQVILGAMLLWSLFTLQCHPLI